MWRCPAQPERAAWRGQLPCACRSQQQRGREPSTSQHHLDPGGSQPGAAEGLYIKGRGFEHRST